MTSLAEAPKRPHCSAGELLVKWHDMDAEIAHQSIRDVDRLGSAPFEDHAELE
jgi:hypothetical protein